SRGRSAGLPGIIGGVSGPNREQASMGVVAISGMGRSVVASPITQSLPTTLFSTRGLGDAQNANRSDGDETVPSGLATNPWHGDGGPGPVSGGSALIARIRGSVTSDEGAPSSGLQPQRMINSGSRFIKTPDARRGPPASEGLR